MTRRAVPFWLRPKWLLGHVLLVVLVTTFVTLGFWQLRRLDERRDRNAEITARSQVPTAPVEALVPPATGPADVVDLRYRRVSASGTYDPAGEVLVRPRSLDGVSGWHVVTPLVLPDGRAVLVTRGFAPLAADPAVARDAAAPPDGDVSITGLVFPSQERGAIGPTDPEEGTLTELARVDVGRVQQQYDRELLPVYVQLERQDPPQGERGLPQLLPTPATDEGPHLSYAVQWFLFAVVGLVGWPVLLRRTARDERRAAAAGAPGHRGGAAPGRAGDDGSDHAGSAVPGAAADRAGHGGAGTDGHRHPIGSGQG